MIHKQVAAAVHGNSRQFSAVKHFHARLIHSIDEFRGTVHNDDRSEGSSPINTSLTLPI
jgi:hypothetical protein